MNENIADWRISQAWVSCEWTIRKWEKKFRLPLTEKVLLPPTTWEAPTKVIESPVLKICLQFEQIFCNLDKYNWGLKTNTHQNNYLVHIYYMLNGIILGFRLLMVHVVTRMYTVLNAFQQTCPTAVRYQLLSSRPPFYHPLRSSDDNGIIPAQKQSL